MTDDVVTITDGLSFPEGPVALSDGSVLLVEIPLGAVTWISAEGKVERRFEVGGGPNGIAVGPDGKIYIANNGGCFTWHDVGGMTVPGEVPDSWTGGCIQRLDLDSGEVEVVYTTSTAWNGDQVPLRAPNDLVFDPTGGFWFTDHGVRKDRASDRCGIHYAAADGSSCREIIFPVDAPNGVGLSPSGDRVYAAETHTGRLWGWALSGPGELNRSAADPLGPRGGHLLHGAPGYQLFDSLAVDGEGYVCVATLINGGVTAISPDGSDVEHHAFPDQFVTNVCFGGDDLRTAYVTLSGTGQLVKTSWPRPGLELAYNR